MKRLIFTLLFLLFCSNGFAQNALIPGLPVLPSKEEISRQMKEIYELRNNSKGKTVPFRQTIPLTDSIIRTLTPMVFVRVYPDPEKEGSVISEVQDDEIVLWSSNGYYYPWRYDPAKSGFRGKYNLNTSGSTGRTNDIKEQINSLLPADVLYTFYTLENMPVERIDIEAGDVPHTFYTKGKMRWYYRYVGAFKDGALIIKDAEGNTYNSCLDLVISNFGSWDRYAEEYNAGL